MPVRRSALLPAALSFFLVTLNATMTITALPAIGHQFGRGAGVAWVVTGYSIVFAACLLPAGAWVDRIGVSRALATGVAVFAAASVACALAVDLGLLLVARAVQGAAAAVVLPAGLSMLNGAAPGPIARGRAVGRWSAAGAVALVVGSPLGGAITSWVGWRGTFWLSVPLSLAVIATATGHRGPPPETGSPSNLMSFVRSAPVVVSSALGFALNFATFGAIFAVTFLLQQELGKPAWTTGLVFVPMTALIVPANLVAGQLTGRLGLAGTLRLGQALMAVGLVGLCVWSPTIWHLTAWLIPIGVGAGLVAPAATTLMLDGVPDERSGLGSGMFNAARQVGSGAAPAIVAVLLGGDRFLTGFRASLLLALVVIALPAAFRLRGSVVCA